MNAKVPPIHPVTGRKVVGVWFKDEDYHEPADQPIGPVGFLYERCECCGKELEAADETGCTDCDGTMGCADTGEAPCNKHRLPHGWRKFDPNRRPDPWVGRENAEALAKAYGVELIES